MTTNINNQVSVTYTDTELRNLVEEYITQQKSEFTLKGVCSYVLYWAIEEGKLFDTEGIIQSKELQSSDQERIRCIFTKIANEGRIMVSADNVKFVQVKK